MNERKKKVLISANPPVIKGGMEEMTVFIVRLFFNNLDLYFYSFIRVVSFVSRLAYYFISYFYPGNYFSENSILPVKEWCISDTDEKL